MQDSLMASWSLGGGGHSSWKVSHLECPGCVFFLVSFFFFFSSSGLLSHFNKGNGRDSRWGPYYKQSVPEMDNLANIVYCKEIQRMCLNLDWVGWKGLCLWRFLSKDTKKEIKKWWNILHWPCNEALCLGNAEMFHLDSKSDYFFFLYRAVTFFI